MNTFEISPDKPLISSDKDILGTKPFAEQLAKALLAYKQPESIVVGLLGPWGSGKSTVLNFIVEYFEKIEDETAPIILSFNPWFFSRQEDIFQLFLRELTLTLKNKGFVEAGERVNNFVKAFKGIELSAFGFGAGVSVDNGNGNELLSLNQTKADISKILMEKTKKIVVILDDIDRLTPEEIRSVFRLIKAVCDFSNVLYLVSFDKQVVVDALNQFHNQKGEEYLEKIIQVPFELPSIEQQNINNLLFEKLNLIIGETPFANDDEQYYWLKIFHYGIEPHLKTPRDVIRLTNSFSLSFEAVRGEVHWVEFLAIETLKVFNTDLYNEIKNNKSKFAGLFDGNDSAKQQEAKKYYEELLARTAQSEPEKTQELLTLLFPRIQCAYRRFSFSSDITLSWRRQLHVCSEDIFDVYFRLGFSQDHIRQIEIDSLLEASSNPESFANKFIEVSRATSSNERIDSLLERLLDYTSDRTITRNTNNIVQAFFNIGDQLLEQTESKKRSLFDSGTRIRIGRLLYWFLKNCSTNDEIFTILKNATEQGTALSIIIDEIKSVTTEPRSRDRYFPNEEQNLNNEQSQELINICLSKIRETVLTGTLLDSPNLLSILYRWKEWTEQPVEIENWVKDLSSTPESLQTLLTKITSCIKSQGSGPVKYRYYIQYSSLSDFINPESIRAEIQKVVDLQLLKDRPEILNAVRKLLQGIDNPDLRNRDHYFDDEDIFEEEESLTPA